MELKRDSKRRRRVTARASQGPVRCSLSLLLLLWIPILNTQLKPETLQAFRRYIATLEQKLAQRNASPDKFLWLTEDKSRLDKVRSGEILIEKWKAPEVPDGMIQHWIGGMFIPDTTIARIEAIDKDYNRYARYYAPDIVRSKLLSQQGEHFKVYSRIQKKKIVTTVMDVWHDVEYVPLAPDRLFVSSRSEHVREVKDAGSASETVLTEGTGTGFLWAMNSYWRMQEKDKGVYLECEAATLARSIPLGFGSIVSPIVESFAQESVKTTLESKKKVIQAK